MCTGQILGIIGFFNNKYLLNRTMGKTLAESCFEIVMFPTCFIPVMMEGNFWGQLT